MDIEGLSEKTAGQLYSALGLRECSQLYSLTKSDLEKLDGFKSRKISNLLGALDKSKKITLERFLFALGIDGVGKVAAKDLARAFKSVENLKNATEEELLELENVGEITAKQIVGWFKDEGNIAEINALFSAGVIPEVAQKAPSDGVFSGEAVVLTGTLQDFKRSDAQKLIEARGGECQSSVTSKTTLVIAGEAAGSKLDKAKKLGVKVIDEAQFKEMLGL